MSWKARSAWTVLALLPGSSAWAQTTARVSVSSLGIEGDGQSGSPSISGDGRYVAFDSFARNLVPGDLNFQTDVFVHDRQNGTTVCASSPPGGPYGFGESYAPSISADGRFVAFRSSAWNLVPFDANGLVDILVHDRVAGTCELASVATNGTQANGNCFYSSISADGRFVAFGSFATNLVPGGTNGQFQLFVRDRLAGTTDLVSVDSNGAQANQGADGPTISADGRFVAFQSISDNLVPLDTNGTTDVFVRDRLNGTTEGVSVQPGGFEVMGESDSPAISADGRFVVFRSRAGNLVPGDTNGFEDLFVRDRLAGSTERVSVGPGGDQANAPSWMPDISADGRFVAFASSATNLDAGDPNGVDDIFVRDRESGTTTRASVSSGGALADAVSFRPSVSDDGQRVAFQSTATNLVPGDTNVRDDVFVRDLRAGSEVHAFTLTCAPGTGAVIACPCWNPPGGPDRGCENSAATGGATLDASGSTGLASDGLVFRTSGERASALSILVQGTAFAGSGLPYGQGVRCSSGTLRRLYSKAASSGAIRVPDFAADDPPVSVRSAAMGDSIQPGQSRWYFVYYRDPVVLGGCPSTSTFNATPTGQVAWSP